MGKGFEKFEKAIAEKKSHEFDKVLEHVRSVCDDEYDALLAQEHKTWERAWEYVRNKAQKQAQNGCAMIDDDVVYGWFDEYVGLDDKAECEKKAMQEAKRKEIAKQANTTTPTAAPSRPKKKDDGQLTLDLFDGDDEEDDASEEEED